MYYPCIARALEISLSAFYVRFMSLLSLCIRPLVACTLLYQYCRCLWAYMITTARHFATRSPSRDHQQRRPSVGHANSRYACPKLPPNPLLPLQPLRRRRPRLIPYFLRLWKTSCLNLSFLTKCIDLCWLSLLWFCLLVKVCVSCSR